MPLALLILFLKWFINTHPPHFLYFLLYNLVKNIIKIIIMSFKKNTKIALISGHNAVSQWAWWRGQISEHLFANEIIPEIMSQASGMAGIEIKHFKREKNTGYCAEMRELHKRVDRWGANISIECHFNAGGKTAKGHEVLYYKNSKGGRIIATAMQKSFNKHLFNRDRGRKPVGAGERGSYGLKIGKARQNSFFFWQIS